MALTSMPSARMFRYEDAFTWATKPSAASNKDRIIRITNIGTNGSFFQSNGTKWFPTATEVLLANDQTSLAITGTTSEVQAFTYTIPAGLMGPNGVLEIVYLFTYTNSANNKNLRVRFGGTAGTIFSSVTATTSDSSVKYIWIRNANSTSSQKGPSSASTTGFGTSTGAAIASFVDTSSATDIVISGALALSTETVTYVGCRISYRE